MYQTPKASSPHRCHLHFRTSSRHAEHRPCIVSSSHDGDAVSPQSSPRSRASGEEGIRSISATASKDSRNGPGYPQDTPGYPKYSLVYSGENSRDQVEPSGKE